MAIETGINGIPETEFKSPPEKALVHSTNDNPDGPLVHLADGDPDRPLVDLARECLESAAQFSRNIQHADGHWCGELRSNPTITAEYVFLNQAFGIDMSGSRQALCQWLFSQQKDDGSWGIAPNYPGDISTTVESYLALKILQIPPESPAMHRARVFILSVGGLAKVRIFTRIYLATFGLFSWNDVPEMPVELVFVSHLGRSCCLIIGDGTNSPTDAIIDAVLGTNQHLQIFFVGEKCDNASSHHLPSSTRLCPAQRQVIHQHLSRRALVSPSKGRSILKIFIPATAKRSHRAIVCGSGQGPCFLEWIAVFVFSHTGPSYVP